MHEHATSIFLFLLTSNSAWMFYLKYCMTETTQVKNWTAVNKQTKKKIKKIKIKLWKIRLYLLDFWRNYSTILFRCENEKSECFRKEAYWKTDFPMQLLILNRCLKQLLWKHVFPYLSLVSVQLLNAFLKHWTLFLLYISSFWSVCNVFHTIKYKDCIIPSECYRQRHL